MAEKGKKLIIIGLLAIIVAHVYIVYRQYFLPYPELFIYPYLTKIGLLPYRDILDQHFPGLMFFNINLATLGLDSPTKLHLLHLAIISINQILIFQLAKKVLGSAKFALLANFFYLLWQPFLEGNQLWIDSFMPLMLVPSLIYLINQKYIKSGLLFGLAIIFKQVLIPIAVLIAVYLWLRDSKQASVRFFLALSLPVLFMILYIMNLGVWSDFYYWTYKFNVTTFAEMGRKYATANEIKKFIFIFFPGALVALISLFREKKHSAIAVFFFGSLIFAYARFDFVHLQPALPFLVIFLSYIFYKIPNKLRNEFLIIYIAFSSIFIAPNYFSLKGDYYKFHSPKEHEVAAVVTNYAKEGEPIFAMATLPHIYQITNTRPSGNVFVFPFPWFMVEVEDRVLQGIIDDPPRVIIRDNTATTAGMNLVSYMPNINEYIEENYELSKKMNEIEILLPKE